MDDLAAWGAKDPNEVLDYAVDWTDRLAGDSIVSATWELPAGYGLTLGAQTNSSLKTTAFISGGLPGRIANVVVRIVTAGGRTHEKTVALPIALS